MTPFDSAISKTKKDLNTGNYKKIKKKKINKGFNKENSEFRVRGIIFKENNLTSSILLEHGVIDRTFNGEKM